MSNMIMVAASPVAVALRATDVPSASVILSLSKDQFSLPGVKLLTQKPIFAKLDELRHLRQFLINNHHPNMKLHLLSCILFLSFSMTIDAHVPTSDPRLDQLNSFCNFPGSPFIYDEKTNRYFIVIMLMKNGKAVPFNFGISYCPFTGIPLPNGAAGYYDIDTHLVDKVNLELGLINDLNEVKKILGKPDHEYGPSDAYQGELLYTSLSKTTTIIIEKIKPNEPVQVMGAGKPKKVIDAGVRNTN